MEIYEIARNANKKGRRRIDCPEVRLLSIVNTTMPITADSCNRMILELVEAYPFCRTEVLTTTAFGRPIRTLVIGTGQRRVLYTAAHHANEWITALVLLKFAEDYVAAIAAGGQIFDQDARSLAAQTTLYMVPLVNPDGVDLVTGEIREGSQGYLQAQRLAENYPQIPFPSGWKANLLGVDLNLQYPAGWLQAREIKFSQGFTQPGPRDYVGRAPLDQVEARALANYTQILEPVLVLAYHTQGAEIYWQFEDIVVSGARELGEEFARVSGYTLADTPYNSSFAGYKDWFIRFFRRPGYTIEAGRGENPLPISQFDEIYADNLGILVRGLQG